MTLKTSFRVDSSRDNALRVLGLIINFGANALLLYGAVGYLRDGSDLGLLVSGVVLTVACILALARPS